MNHRPHLAPSMFLTAMAATSAWSQSHEPLHPIDQIRHCFVDVEDADSSLESFHAQTMDVGDWLESGSREIATAAGRTMQMTRVADDYIGGILGCRVINLDGQTHTAGSGLQVIVEIHRTGRLRANAEFSGVFASDWNESYALFQVSRLNNDDTADPPLLEWINRGTKEEDPTILIEDEFLIRPGRYLVWQEVHTEVFGTMEEPDVSEMRLVGELRLDRLPDCGAPAAGSCLEKKDTPSCDDATCCDRVCDVDPYCCDNQWDAICVAGAESSCSPCVGDLNGDRTVDGADQGLLFAGWGEHPPFFIHPADLNADGVVDGLDLGTLFSLWGDC